jgi:hypothetical protein
MSGQQGTPNQAATTAQLQRNVILASILQALKGLGIQVGPASSTASAGSATLPAAPVGFRTLTFPDGTTGKVAVYGP